MAVDEEKKKTLSFSALMKWVTKEYHKGRAVWIQGSGRK